MDRGIAHARNRRILRHCHGIDVAIDVEAEIVRAFLARDIVEIRDRVAGGIRQAVRPSFCSTSGAVSLPATTVASSQSLGPGVAAPAKVCEPRRSRNRTPSFTGVSSRSPHLLSQVRTVRLLLVYLHRDVTVLSYYGD